MSEQEERPSVHEHLGEQGGYVRLIGDVAAVKKAFRESTRSATPIKLGFKPPDAMGQATRIDFQGLVELNARRGVIRANPFPDQPWLDGFFYVSFIGALGPNADCVKIVAHEAGLTNASPEFMEAVWQFLNELFPQDGPRCYHLPTRGGVQVVSSVLYGRLRRLPPPSHTITNVFTACEDLLIAANPREDGTSDLQYASAGQLAEFTTAATGPFAWKDLAHLEGAVVFLSEAAPFGDDQAVVVTLEGEFRFQVVAIRSHPVHPSFWPVELLNVPSNGAMNRLGCLSCCRRDHIVFMEECEHGERFVFRNRFTLPEMEHLFHALDFELRGARRRFRHLPATQFAL